MTDDPSDDLEEFRRELAELGLTGAVKPEDFGLEFRSAESFTVPVSKLERRRRLPRWIPPTFVAAAAAVLVVAIVVPKDGDPSNPGSPGASISPDFTTVAQVLDRAAEVSGEMPDLSDARFWRLDLIQKQGKLPPARLTSWLGHHEPGLVVDDFGPARTPPARFWFKGKWLTWDQFVALPADPVYLRALLDEKVADLPYPTYYVVKEAAELLAQSPAPPALRKALWQVIADVPGVISQGRVRDSLGREGYGLVFDVPARSKVQYIVDPEKGTILEIRSVVHRGGEVPYRGTFLSQGPTNEPPPSK